MKHCKKFFSRVLWVVPAVLILLVSGVQVMAQRATLMQDDVPEEGITDPAELEAFWDGFFRQEMEDFGVRGAVMVMVKDGEMLFSKGYGYADAAKRVPFDPEDTILRAGSIAKTVTATAVMQLAEQGKLDLDADVNDYLTRFKVPDTFAEPVTARQLINMTGGFDTRSIGIRAASAEEVQPLGEYLAERMPPRVLPPGRYRRYNDHEIALAGYLVEVVSGMPYAQYVRERIFEPLEMADSSIWLPEEQLGRAARGYPVGEDEAYPLNYYYLNDAPGAGFNSTADDMAHYMIAHLQNGAYTRSDGIPARILEAATAGAMHRTAFSYHPEMAGQANAFDEQFHNGHRYLRKSGGAPGMHNNMLLLLDQGLGFYLFYNSEGTGLRNSWQGEVLEMYFSTPGPNAALLQPAGKAGGPVSRYAGIYQEISDGTSETTIVQVQALVDPDRHV
ncbi:MAG TPA: serine hydrolase domain-containing protein, partial [Anaerolineales bacterium]